MGDSQCPKALWFWDWIPSRTFVCVFVFLSIYWFSKRAWTCQDDFANQNTFQGYNSLDRSVVKLGYLFKCNSIFFKINKTKIKQGRCDAKTMITKIPQGRIKCTIESSNLKAMQRMVSFFMLRCLHNVKQMILALVPDSSVTPLPTAQSYFPWMRQS